MRQYLDLLQTILDRGEVREDRTETGTRGIFGYQNRYDLSEGFPLITTKKIPMRLIIHELLWFLSGSTNAKPLWANKVHIWDEWVKDDGDLGPIYGAQWRSWPGKIVMSKEWVPPESGRIWQLMDSDHRFHYQQPIDQIAGVINDIQTSPYSRRHIVSAWNPAQIDEMALAPCHCLFQFYVSTGGKLSCHLYQRSGDVFLGVPFNIASYALLTMMVAQVCNLKVGEFIHTFGDVHLYSNHHEQAKLQLQRKPKTLPTMHLNPLVDDIFKFRFEDFELRGYDAHSHIPADVAA